MFADEVLCIDNGDMKGMKSKDIIGHECKQVCSECPWIICVQLMFFFERHGHRRERW